MANKTKTGLETFRSGERVRYSGEYVLVDERGKKQDFDIITLDEGETFPEASGKNLCYMLSDTSLDESYDAMDEEMPDIE